MKTLAEVGQELRAAREARGLTLEAVAAETHMKVSHLRAIEAGDETVLPEPVYVKSFIRKYAQAVGLPADELANAYWETKPLPPAPPQQREISVPWWLFPWIVAAILIGIVVYFIAVAPRAIPEAGPLVTPSVAPSPSPQPASPSVAPGAATPSASTATETPPISTPTTRPVAATPTPMPTPSAQSTPRPTPSPAATPTSISVAPGTALRLQVVVNEASWMRVLRDGVQVYEGTLRAGETRAWAANDTLNISIGNAGGVEVLLDNRSLGTLGAKGEVVRRVFKRGEE